MLILASQSPRRREILERAGLAHVVRSAEVPEQQQPGESPREYVVRLARAKAQAISASPNDAVIGADTVVVLGDRVLEKPFDAAEAAAMLRDLAGREHSVLTGFCICTGDGRREGVEETRVRFLPLSESEIGAYVSSGEPMDKAGAYAIQGLASKFIDRIEGDYFNVVGLPVARVYQMLKESGYQIDTPG